MAQFRKTKTFGGLRLSASKRGAGVSFGKGPLRLSVGADGKVRRTVRIPGTGIYDTKVIGATGRAPGHAATSVEPEVEKQVLTFEADDSPASTNWQRSYVRVALKGKVAEMPDLSELTIGQAEQLLEAVGASPQALYRNGRMWGAKKEQQAWLAQRVAS